MALLFLLIHQPCVADDAGDLKKAAAGIDPETANVAVNVLSEVGSPFSQGKADFTSLAAMEGTLYVAFQDGANGNKITVKRHSPKPFSREEWQAVGEEGFSEGVASFIHLACDGITPYVAYLDKAEGPNIIVKKYDGKKWKAVGKTDFKTQDFDLAFDGGAPYLAYGESDGGKSAMFDGKNWVPAFGGVFQDGKVDNISLAFDPKGHMPWVAFSNEADHGRLTVKSYPGKWVVIGHEGISAGSASATKLVFEPTAVYVAFSDYVDKPDYHDENGNWWQGVDRVMSADVGPDGLAWADVGPPLPRGYGVFSLAFRSGQPYLAHMDRSNKTKVLTAVSADGNWTSLNPMGFTSGLAFCISMVYDEKADDFFLAYSDQSGNGKGKVFFIDPKEYAPLKGSH